MIKQELLDIFLSSCTCMLRPCNKITKWGTMGYKILLPNSYLPLSSSCPMSIHSIARCLAVCDGGRCYRFPVHQNCPHIISSALVNVFFIHYWWLFFHTVLGISMLASCWLSFTGIANLISYHSLGCFLMSLWLCATSVVKWLSLVIPLCLQNIHPMHSSKLTGHCARSQFGPATKYALDRKVQVSVLWH